MRKALVASIVAFGMAFSARRSRAAPITAAAEPRLVPGSEPSSASA